MKLATFRHQGKTRVGVLDREGLLDLAAANAELPQEMGAFLEAGGAALDQARAAAATKHRIPLPEVELQAPVLRPGKFLGVGLNYADHIAETGRETPEFPVFFNKQSTCVNRTGGEIHLPRASYKVDYEGELAFVIGRRCRHVPKQQAHRVIAGYTIVNDVSVRDWQRRAPTLTLGKSWDTHGPMGPWIVTSDEITDPHCLGIRTFVNDEKRQESNTRELIFNCFVLVEILSTVCTLEPGDTITTGTSSGVAAAMEEPEWLKPGDRVRIEIDGIGALENRAVPEPEESAFLD